MLEQGIVSEVKEGKLIVNIRRHPACGSCNACSRAEDRLMRMEFDNTIDARKGDRVNIELDNALFLRGAFLFYVVPLLGLMLGLFIGSASARKISFGLPDEAVSALFGIIIMLITFIAIRRYNLKNKERFKPRVWKA